MGLFDKFKNILGFGSDEEDDFIEVESVQPKQAIAQSVSAPAGEIEASPEMVHKIFDKVVEITNASIPQYFAKSVNPEQQKKYLYDALDSSIKTYIASLEASAHEKCKAQWQKEHDGLKLETENLKQKARDLEAKRTEMKEQNLSSERQKRALSERVHDLEAKVMQLEAEKEQLDLENHSLVNKIKVANVQGADIEVMRQELEQLKAEGASKELVDENESLKQKIEELNNQINALNDACEAAKVKDAMGTNMLNELQKKASEAQGAITDANAKVETLTKDLEQRDARIDDLMQEIEDKEAQIEEYEEALDGVQKIVDQLDLFGDIKAKLENKIKELTDQLKEAHRDNDTLRTTIKNNLYAHAQEQKALRDQIERLRNAPGREEENNLFSHPVN